METVIVSRIDSLDIGVLTLSSIEYSNVLSGCNCASFDVSFFERIIDSEIDFEKRNGKILIPMQTAEYLSREFREVYSGKEVPTWLCKVGLFGNLSAGKLVRLDVLWFQDFPPWPIDRSHDAIEAKVVFHGIGGKICVPQHIEDQLKNTKYSEKATIQEVDPDAL